MRTRRGPHAGSRLPLREVVSRAEEAWRRSDAEAEPGQVHLSSVPPPDDDAG